MRSAAVLTVLPSAAAGVSVTQNATPWANSAWVEVTASAPAGATLAGVFPVGGTFSSDAREIDVAIGASSSEVVIATFRQGLPGSTAGTFGLCWAAIPISGIGGERVSVRVRASDTGSDVLTISVYFYTSDLSLTDALLTCVPAGTTGATITGNGTAWANSNYAELTSGIGVPIAIVGLAILTTNFQPDFEIDIATGAASSETVITTMAGTGGSGAGVPSPVNFLLPAPMDVDASTRIAVRLRKSGTATDSWVVNLRPRAIRIQSARRQTHRRRRRRETLHRTLQMLERH